MKRALEATAFLGVAAGLHLAAAALELPATESGASSAGSGGEQRVSVSAAPEQVVELVEQWESAPEVETAEQPARPVAEPVEAAPEAPAPAPPDVPSPSAPAPQMPDLAEAPAAAVDLPSPVPEAPAPPPEPEPEPEPAVEPEPEPQDEQIAGVRPRIRPDRPEPPPEPQREAQPEPSQPRQAQRSSGEGGGANAGSSQREAVAASADPARVQSARRQWGAQIRTLVERNQRYPSGAARRSGEVVVTLTVDRAGALRGLSLSRSSGDRALDQAAVRAVQAAGRFPPAPSELGQGSFTFSLPMQFDR